METISFASQPVMHLQKAGWKKKAKKNSFNGHQQNYKENPLTGCFSKTAFS
jgi:hypothetical protein